MTPHFPVALGGCLFALAAAPAPSAQCSNQWLPGLGTPGANDRVVSMTMWDPDGPGPAGRVLVVAGFLSLIGSVQTAGVATIEPNIGTWSALPVPPPSPTTGSYFHSLTTTAAGDLVMLNQTTALRWNGTTWSQFGAVNSGGILNQLAAMPNGEVVAGGSFTSIGGVAATNIARWDGTTWHPLGTGLTGASLYVVSTLLAMPTGDVIAGGTFANAGGVPCNNVARWNGSSWSAMGGGVNGGVYCLTEMSGDVIVAGSFTSAGTVPAPGLARWNGATWAALGGSMGYTAAMLALPNGDLVMGGWYDPGGASQSFPWFGRLSGSVWTFESIVGWQMGSSVSCLARLPGGDIVVGGIFMQAGGLTALNLGRWTTTCPATATALGTGCTGSGGANVLTATSLPWIGATCTTRATGMPALGLAVRALGLTTVSVPLTAILPQGTAGCSLFVSPDLLDLHLPASGTVSPALAIPNTIALANQTLHQQVGVFEFDALGGIIALTSTNALTLTIGAF